MTEYLDWVEKWQKQLAEDQNYAIRKSSSRIIGKIDSKGSIVMPKKTCCGACHKHEVAPVMPKIKFTKTKLNAWLADKESMQILEIDLDRDTYAGLTKLAAELNKKHKTKLTPEDVASYILTEVIKEIQANAK